MDIALDKRIYESASTLVQRGHIGERAVVAKTLKPEATGPNAIARYHHEFAVNQSLTSPYVVRALAMADNETQIIFEDVGAEALRELIRQGNLAFEQKLAIAIQLCAALQSIHDEGVIHRDVNPSNIICNPEAELVRVIDFGLATLSPREYPDASTITHLTGTLPYVSPEQTGRVNRVVDYRTDLYSLGATLYELFTGSPPFTNTDPLELIHYHIARTPHPMREVNPTIPGWLSDIVAKLLAKQPEDRYQSASAARSDLEEGYELWASHADVEHFALGRSDTSGQLSIPKRLYGRDSQIGSLNTLLDRVARSEVAVARVIGGPGIGKAAFTDLIAANVAERHGLSARVPGTSPASSTGMALLRDLAGSLVRQLLSHPGTGVEEFATRLRRLTNDDPAPLAALVPDLAPIVGPPPNELHLGRGEEHLMRALLRAFSPIPVALIVEHAERYDPESIQELLSVALHGRHVLVVITSEHADLAEFDDSRIAAKTTNIELTLLDKNHVRTMLSEMLSQPESRVRELAAEIHAKTDGMPGHVLELLFELHSQNAIRYDGTHSHWAWDINRVRSHFFSDNTRERILRQLERLPAETLGVMQVGACIGDSFSLGLAAAISDNGSEADLAAVLRRGVGEGLIAGVRDERDGSLSFQFAHPRVRALIYEQLSDDAKRDLHLTIADALIKSDASGADAPRIADQFNAGCGPFGVDDNERQKVAHYNLLAARECLRRGQFQPAFKYCRSGLALFDDGKRPPPTDLIESLLVAAAESAFLCGDFDQLKRALDQADSDLPSSPVALDELRIRADLARNQLDDALGRARAGLAAIDYKPQKSPPWSEMLAARPLKGIVAELKDARHKRAFRLMAHLLHAGYHRGTGANAGLAMDIIRRSAQVGYSPESAFAFAAEAVSAIDRGTPERAVALANNARHLCRAFPDDVFSVRTQTLLAGLVDHWTGSLDQTLPALTQNTRRSIALHDYEFALVGIVFFAINALMRGMDLSSLARELAERIDDVEELRHVTATNIARFIQQVVQSLLGHGREDDSNEGVSFSNPNDHVALACIYTLRLYFAILFNDYQGAANVVGEAQRYIDSLTGSPLQLVYVFCAALVELNRDNQKGGRPARLRSGPKHALKLLRRAANDGCQFAAPKALILEAAWAWQRGNRTVALEKYEAAAESARRLGLANDEALAYELAGRACEKSARTDFTRLFLRNAYQTYLRWGALAKSNQLEREFQPLLADAKLARPESGTWSVGDLVDLTVRDFASVSGTYESQEFGQRLIDTTTVLKAAQTISGEIVLDRVLIKLLRLALEHAGAQKACMLLATDGRLYIDAVAAVDGGTTRRLSPPVPLEDSDEVPQSLLQFVARTKQTLVLADATREDVFTQDNYIKSFQPLSVMALPILSRNEVIGVLYVEHRWLTGVFTSQRVEVLSLLASQAAISIENARLYADLQSTRDEYRTLYESANEGLFRITADGVLIRANPTLARILGFGSTTALLEDYRDLLDRVFLKKDRAQEMLSQLDERGVVGGFEAEGVARDGRTFWMSINARINQDPEQGEVIDGSVIDITSRIEREQADKRREVAEAASHAKSEFLANMSHEIRTPMNAILGFSKLTLETSLDRKQREYLSSIRNAAESLLSLVNDVLDFEKIEAGKLRLESAPFQLRETLKEVERLFRTEVRKKGLTLAINDYTSEAEAFPADGVVLGDVLRLKQVLINLIGNAIKFTQEGGVTVDVRLASASGSNLELTFAVTDTGIGISQDQMTRLFESFEQAETSTTRRFGGTGLGLAICRSLVEVMGGEISVQSTPDHGSVFSFNARFHRPVRPVAIEEVAEPRNRPRSADVLRGLKILLAEDNPINQQLALEYLQGADAMVDVAETGRIAVEKSHEKDYDVILMDIHMPEMDGLEAASVIRKRDKQVPIIAVSADALEERRSTALEAGCDGYITKPIDFDQLLAMLDRVLQAGEAIAEIPRRRASDPMVDAEAAARFSGQRVPGIDVGEAIRNHNGNVQLMLKLMGDFGKYYGDAGSKMRDAVTTGDLDAAERLAHNLHGVAGSFGAAHLKDASKTLELAVAKGERKNLLGLVHSFEMALNEVLESAEALASNEVSFRATDFDAVD